MFFRSPRLRRICSKSAFGRKSSATASFTEKIGATSGAGGSIALKAGTSIFRRCAITAGLLLAFSGALEIAQGLMHQGRTADWFDLLANGLGLASGLGVSALGLGRWMIWVENLLLRARK